MMAPESTRQSNCCKTPEPIFLNGWIVMKHYSFCQHRHPAAVRAPTEPKCGQSVTPPAILRRRRTLDTPEEGKGSKVTFSSTEAAHPIEVASHRRLHEDAAGSCRNQTSYKSPFRQINKLARLSRPSRIELHGAIRKSIAFRYSNPLETLMHKNI